MYDVDICVGKGNVVVFGVVEKENPEDSRYGSQNRKGREETSVLGTLPH